MDNNKKIAAIGECIIELRPEILAVGYSDATIDALLESNKPQKTWGVNFCWFMGSDQRN